MDKRHEQKAKQIELAMLAKREHDQQRRLDNTRQRIAEVQRELRGRVSRAT